MPRHRHQHEPDHHHHHHGPHGPHAHKWFYNDEQRLALALIGARQKGIASQLVASSSVDLGGLTVELPERVHAVLRHETHHGDLVLKLDLKWFDRPTAIPPHPHPPHAPHHWVFSYEGEMTLKQAGELLHSIGDQVIDHGTVACHEHTVCLPAEALMVVRYERGPRGDLVFKNELVWAEGATTTVERSIVELLP